MRRVAALVAVLAVAALAALAQEEGQSQEEENGFLINLLTNAISAPGREVTVSGVSGALSSQARIAQIRISDDTGPWLEIDNVEIDWSRAQLLLGRVNVERLAIERIAVLRPPEPPARRPLPAPEAAAEPFALPELPVSVRLNALDVTSIMLAEQILGRAADLSLQGRLSLAGGALDTELQVAERDQPGTSLDLAAAFSNETRELALDVGLQSPQGGLLSTALRIEGEPAIDLQLNGAGPLDNVDVTFTLDADDMRVAEGLVALRGSDDGLGFDVDLRGELSPLIPPDFRDFFEGETSVVVSGLNKADGGLRIDSAEVSGAVLDLGARLETGTDGFLQSLNLSGTLGDPAAPPVLLPVPGADTRLNSAVVRVNYGGASRWDGFVVLDRLEAGDLEVEDLTLNVGGLARNLQDPATRMVTVTLEGLATGLWSDDPRVRDVLGTRLDLFADAALPAGGPIDIRQVQLSGNGLSLFTAGQLQDLTYGGRTALRVSDIAVLSGLAGRPLSGSLALRTDGSVSPLSGGFDLTVDGGLDDVTIGDPRADALLAGATAISGRAVRDAAGIRTEDLRIENDQLAFSSDGRIATSATDFGFEARLNELSLIDPQLAGPLTASGRAEGSGREIDVTLDAAIPEGRLMERAIRDLRLGFAGSVDGTDVAGTLSGGGRLDDLAIDLAGDIAVEGEQRAVSGLRLAVGPNILTGDVSQSGTAPIEGEIAFRAPDIAPLAALALVEATGAIQIDATLGAAVTGQAIDLTATARDVAAAGSRLGSADIDLSVSDAFGLPLIDGDVAARDILAGGLDIAAVNARARQEGPNGMDVAADARLAIGTLMDLTGRLERRPQGFAATLQTLRLRQEPAMAELTAPATVTVEGGTVTLTPLALDLGTGSLTAEGRVGEEIDLDLAITTLPVDLANTILPSLGLAGQISGTATVSGPRSAPDIAFDLSASGLEAEATRAAGLPAISAEANGRTEEGRLRLDAEIASANGLSATAAGAVPLGDGDLDLTVDLRAFPLALVDRAAGNQGLTGTVTGQARVTGPLAAPVAEFSVEGAGISAAPLRDNGLPPISFAVAGGFADQAVRLTQADLSGPPGLTLRGSGTVPLAGPGLDVQVAGQVPLALADPILEQRAAQARGTLQINATASGSITAPQFGGTVALDGGTFVDPDVNVRLENISLDASLSGTNVVLQQFRAEASAGGSITAEGSVSLDTAQGLPADMDLRINDLRYTDGAFVNTQLSGALSLDGPILDGGLLSGTIDLGRTEISVAEGLGAGAGASLEQVMHVRPPPRVQTTLDRAQIGEPEPPQPSGRSGLRLDIRINAPNQIFVRGRGLDAELGGSVTIQGTVDDIQPVGEFALRRGRILILTQRIDFTEGTLTLIGDLDPQVNFEAQSQAGDVTAIVTVSGRVSDPEIGFSSQPPLPEDEVLAQLLFGRSSDNLSAFQLAQLAAAAAELAGGGGGPGILGQLRSAAGLDNLDIVTDESGATAARAGRYLSEDAYLEVQTDTEGVSRAEIVLELTDRITARGSVGSDGNSTLGLFFERDY